MMATLRDHGSKAAEDRLWSPARGTLMETLCVHASFGPLRPSQSTGSLVAHLAPDLPTYWLTGTSAPCTGIFKPVYLGGAGLPDLGPEPTGTYDPDSVWWTHERLHREVIRDYPTRIRMLQEERDAQEAQFLRQAAEMYERFQAASPKERTDPLAKFTRSCFEQALVATKAWASVVAAAPIRHRPPRSFSAAWGMLNRQAKFPKRKRRTR
jgi:dipeptidase